MASTHTSEQAEKNHCGVNFSVLRVSQVKFECVLSVLQVYREDQLPT